MTNLDEYLRTVGLCLRGDPRHANLACLTCGTGWWAFVDLTDPRTLPAGWQICPRKCNRRRVEGSGRMRTRRRPNASR
jgi:hypothetical protein